MLAIKDGINLNSSLSDMESCAKNTIEKGMLDEDFKTSSYTLRTYTSGCYFFDIKEEMWKGTGITVRA